eukprot:7398891-Alexandrium_andersonii.AAC.1
MERCRDYLRVSTKPNASMMEASRVFDLLQASGIKLPHGLAQTVVLKNVDHALAGNDVDLALTYLDASMDPSVDKRSIGKVILGEEEGGIQGREDLSMQ